MHKCFSKYYVHKMNDYLRSFIHLKKNYTFFHLFRFPYNKNAIKKYVYYSEGVQQLSEK